MTDSGINTLLLLSPQLEALHLNSLPVLQGLFVPTALQQCPQLATLQVGAAGQIAHTAVCARA